MKKNRTLLLAAALLMGLSVGIPAQADPPSWAPAHGYRKHQREYHYIYYPAQRVYYAPASRRWFWSSGNHWQAGATLPPRWRVMRGDGVSVTLGSSRPYTQHVYVEERYGRPWRARHAHHHKEFRHHKDHKKFHGHKEHRKDRDWHHR